MSNPIDKPAWNEEWRVCWFTGQLNEDETVQSVDSVTMQEGLTGPITTADMISGAAPYNGTGVRYQLKGGTPGKTYIRVIRIISSNGQKLEDKMPVKVV